MQALLYANLTERTLSDSLGGPDFDWPELIEGDTIRVGLRFAQTLGDEELEIEGHSVTLGAIRRYTGMQVYNRPHEWVLVLGSLLMFLGLVWHFYFRHRDRRRAGKGDA